MLFSTVHARLSLATGGIRLRVEQSKCSGWSFPWCPPERFMIGLLYLMPVGSPQNHARLMIQAQLFIGNSCLSSRPASLAKVHECHQVEEDRIMVLCGFKHFRDAETLGPPRS